MNLIGGPTRTKQQQHLARIDMGGKICVEPIMSQPRFRSGIEARDVRLRLLKSPCNLREICMFFIFDGKIVLHAIQTAY